jgi:hypothetical protein
VRKWLILLFTLILLTICTAQAETVTGLAYDDFLKKYAENLDFINDNAGRHLLPLIPAKRDAGWNDGRLYYEIFGDVLTLTIRTDSTGQVIEYCSITLTAPADMSYGSTIHRDFTTSGYQSYGMLMAMAAGETAYDRYQLVTEVEEGLKNGGGVFYRQIGVYQLEAVSQNGAVTMTFTNTTAAPTPSPEPSPSPTPDPNAEPTPEPELAG